MSTDFSFVPEHYAARTHEKMQEVLLHPEEAGPAVHYYMIRGGVEQKNITVWEPGTVGGEYIKTYGHYHVGNLEETYWILYGAGIALEQQRVERDGQPVDSELMLFRATPVKAGQSLHFAPGHGHLVVNIGETFLVTADDSPVEFGGRLTEASLPGHADYHPVQALCGFAYYVVEHDGRPALVKNHHYTKIIQEDLGGLPVLAT